MYRDDVQIILSFTEEYYFLSNFYNHPVFYDGLLYQNSEAAFQSAKCINYEDRRKFTELDPSAAKKLGRRVKLREDWELIKDYIMYTVVKAKFSDPALAKKLLDTGNAELYEGNTWGDTYWGIDRKTLKGQNVLGSILMQVRKDIAKGIIPVNLQNN